MYDPPVYLWVIIIAGTAAFAAAACAVLYSGAVRAGLGRTRAGLLTGGVAVLLGGWFTATAVIAGHGWYHAPLSQGPWLPIAVAGFLGTLLALSRIPVVARALKAPGMASRLLLRTRSGWKGWSSCCMWRLVTCPRCSPCPRAWATSPPGSRRRWWRTG